MKTIHELALETLSELDRRGWFQGGLARTYLYDAAMKTHKDFTPEDAAVCAVGAMSSAYNNFDPYSPGYNDTEYDYDNFDANGEPTLIPPDPDYKVFMDATLDMIHQTYPGRGTFGETKYRSVAGFNDDRRTDEAMVRDIFQKVAEKYKYAPAVADAAA